VQRTLHIRKKANQRGNPWRRKNVGGARAAKSSFWQLNLHLVGAACTIPPAPHSGSRATRRPHEKPPESEGCLALCQNIEFSPHTSCDEYRVSFSLHPRQKPSEYRGSWIGRFRLIRILSGQKRFGGVFIFRKCLKASGAPNRS
jgi:hypothetical protein